MKYKSNRNLLLEISVETFEAAMAAERGGADRIELCADLHHGGVTPSISLMRIVRKQLHLPIFVMIRPRAGDFVYSRTELAVVQRDIQVAKDQGMKGVVLGLLKRDNSIDIERTRELVELAHPLPVTFHRAFDISGDLLTSLEDVVQTGVMRVLTSGGARSAPEGLAALAGLVQAARERTTIVPGAGINSDNILRVARETGAREFHSGLSTSLPHPRKKYEAFELQVRELSRLIRS
ncbi:MAG TPA: copper homeostasis protein CutC [Candidatus Dormibacteraeota bacterium]|nr:copper homeostasis protein CutC [Candidatus Dormibacteraeota bacterium]